jgi:DNA-binding response OmpR family regulator
MTGQNAIKMLSIDDKTLTTDLDRAGYRKMGVYVRCAANYEEAQKLLRAEKIDLVVINMDYRAVDAVQVVRHLKAQDEWKETPMVLTSVQTAARVRNSALEAGADLFVEQPLPRQYFIEKLKQLLEHKTRSSERVSVHGDARVTWEGQTAACPIGDLSVSGILLSTELEFKDGTKVVIEFDLPGQKKAITVEGEVARTIRYTAQHPDRKTGVGIRFAAFKSDSEHRLVTYIEKHASTDQRLKYYL